jgi:hypothetical protein
VSDTRRETVGSLRVARGGFRGVAQSPRSAAIGSTAVARRAGIQAAATATANSSSADAAIVGGSAGSTP